MNMSIYAIPGIKGSILDAVAIYYGVTLQQIKSKDRHQPIVRARQMAMYLLYNVEGLSHTVSASKVNRDRITCFYSCAKIDQELELYNETQTEVRKVKSLIYK